MRNLKRLIFIIIALLIAAAIVVFVLENQQSFALVFFGWNAPELPVAVPVIFALLVGMMISPRRHVYPDRIGARGCHGSRQR
jgi:putative membrane protein